MYKFICPEGHVSYSAAREQTESGCPTCHAPSQIVEEDES